MGLMQGEVVGGLMSLVAAVPWLHSRLVPATGSMMRTYQQLRNIGTLTWDNTTIIIIIAYIVTRLFVAYCIVCDKKLGRIP